MFNFGSTIGILDVDQFKKLAQQVITNEVFNHINEAEFRQFIQGEINRLSSGYIDHSNPEGSGPHAQRWPNPDDLFISAVFRGVALAARARGMDNAAQHMEYYLSNSGVYLTFSGTKLYNDVPKVRTIVEEEKRNAIAEARAKHTSIVDFTITGLQKAGYVQRTDSQNWFFAVGGHTYWYTANVKTKTRVLDLTVRFTDVYNWDKSKTTDILGINFPDKVLGRMHQAGIAREFSMGGSASFLAIKY